MGLISARGLRTTKPISTGQTVRLKKPLTALAFSAQWTPLKTGGVPPPPVEKAAMVVVGSRVFLLGGDCGDVSEDEPGIQVLQGLFELDLEVRLDAG